MSTPDDNQPRQTIIAKEGSTVKNVIQAIIHLPAWAWVFGIVILSISLLAGAAVFNIDPLQKLLPTPTAFLPATADQSLIIVADFDNRSDGKYTGIDPAQYVFEQLVGQAQKDNLDVRVERLYQVVDDNTAKTAGTKYNATLVVWGWYDSLTITPRMARVKTLEGKISDQEGLRLSLADPDKVEFSVLTDLPSQASYLVMFTLAMDKFTNEDFDEALIYFENAIQSIPTSKVSTNPSEAFFYRAYIYYHQNDYDNAIANYSKAIELKLDYAAAYHNRGIVYKTKGEYNRAIADYNKAIELAPDQFWFYRNRGAAYYYKGDYNRAIADYSKAIQLNTNEAICYTDRGAAYDSIGDYNHALADFNKAIQLNPDYALAYYNRGSIFARKGMHDLAIADNDKAIQLQPDYASAYNNRCWEYYELGQYEVALPDCEKAIELDPDNPYSLDSRGFVYVALGRKSDAIKDFERVLELSKNPILRERAEEELKKLKGK